MLTLRPRRSLVVCLLLMACGPKQFDDAEGETESESGDEGYSDHAGSNGGEICDPLAQDCAGGMTCTIGDSDTPFVCVATSCGLSEDRPCQSEGEVCLWFDDCLPGLICLNGLVTPGCGNEVACCTRYCDLDNPLCPPSTSCQAYEDLPSIEHVGACVTAP